VTRRLTRRASAALVLGLILLATQAHRSEAGLNVAVSWYLPTGNVTASGVYPYPGSAGCSLNFPLGTVLAFEDGREVVCLDRGLLGTSGHVDIYVPSRAEGAVVARSYGGRADVDVLRWGW
jgi:hypothetical protein